MHLTSKSQCTIIYVIPISVLLLCFLFLNNALGILPIHLYLNSLYFSELYCLFSFTKYQTVIDNKQG